MSNRPEVEATYFRDYGVHTVEDAKGDPVHIFSEPTWGGLELSLERNLPDSGTVLTTEQATFVHHQKLIADNKKEINTRVEIIRELSRETDARILLSTPIRDKTKRLFSSVLHLERGVLQGIDLKRGLSPYEDAANVISPAPSAERAVRAGQMVLICSELAMNRDIIRQNGYKLPHTVLVPSCWALPAMRDSLSQTARADGVEAAGSVDAYFINSITKWARETMYRLPSVQRIIVTDRLVQESGCDGPINAVFDRA